MVLACIATAAPALADTPADEDYQKALALYSADKAAESIPYFERAYEKTKAPQALYGLAVAELSVNRCDAALPHFRQYLDTNPSADSRSDTRGYIADCWAKLPVDTQVGGASGTPFYKSIGALGVYTGAISVGVGVAFMFKASSTRDAASDAQFADDFDAKLDEATGQRRFGITLMVAGGLLAAGGLTYYLVTKPSGKPSTSVAVTPSSIWFARAF